MHISMTAEFAPGISPRPSILRSAEIIASGFFVSSTDPASARYSRERDSASRTTTERSHATAISATAIRIAITAPPDPFLSSDEDEERLLPPPPKEKFERKKMRKN